MQTVSFLYKNIATIAETVYNYIKIMIYEVAFMIIKASASLRNEYSKISSLAHETNEPIYITKNGEGDMVLMSIDAFERREQILEMRSKVLQAEQERINGAKTMSLAEARMELRKRTDAM